MCQSRFPNTPLISTKIGQYMRSPQKFYLEISYSCFYKQRFAWSLSPFISGLEIQVVLHEN